jgi:hypothetical protein
METLTAYIISTGSSVYLLHNVRGPRWVVKDAQVGTNKLLKSSFWLYSCVLVALYAKAGPVVICCQCLVFVIHCVRRCQDQEMLISDKAPIVICT